MSIYNNASDPESIETLIKIDDDDEATIELFRCDEEVRGLPNIRLFNGPRVGFINLYKVFTRLFMITGGDIILPFSDDLEITLEKWDNKFWSYRKKPVLIGHKYIFAFTRKAMDLYMWLRVWNGRTKGADGRMWERARRMHIYKDLPLWFDRNSDGDLTKRQRKLKFIYIPSYEVEDWKNNL